MSQLVIDTGEKWGHAASPLQWEDAEAVLDLDATAPYHFILRARGYSKALWVGTPLPTPTGWTTMGEAQIGDELLDEQGLPTRITGISEIRFAEECFRLTFADGSTLIASADHEWVVEDHRARGRRNRRGIADPWATELERANTDELVARVHCGPRGDRSLSVPVARPWQLTPQTLPIPPYVLGYWLGDGNADSPRITVGYQDTDAVSKLFANEGYPLTEESTRCLFHFGHPLGYGKAGRVNEYDSSRSLTQLGVKRNKHIPISYLRSAYDQRLALLRGLMDSDGHNVRSGVVEFSNTNKVLVDDVAHLISTLGWKCVVRTETARLNGRVIGPVYKVNFRPDVVPFALQRKTEKWHPRGAQASRHNSRMIASIERIPSVAVKCVTVDSPSHLYLAGPAGIPTHNSADLAGMAVAVMCTQAPIGARLYGAAADKDQARLLLDSMHGYVLRTPYLEKVLSVKNYEATCSVTHSTYEALAADAAGAYGLRPYFTVVDEICQWPSTNAPLLLWEAITSAMHKVPGARMAVISSAGDPAHWSKGIRDHAEKHELWRLQETPGPPPWIDPIKLDEQKERLPESSFRRLFLNEWTASEDRLVTEADINACMVLDSPRALDQDTSYVMGLDIGLRNDRTVVAIAHNEVIGGRSCVVLDDMKVWQGNRDNPVVLSTVEHWMLDRVRNANQSAIISLVYDPHQAVGLAQRIREHGILAVEYPFTVQSVSHLALTMVTMLRDHTLLMYPDEDLREEMMNVRMKEPSPGFYRIDHDPSRHDDRVIALAMAAQTLALRPAVSWASAYGFRECCGGVIGENDMCPKCRQMPPPPLLGIA